MTLLPTIARFVRPRSSLGRFITAALSPHEVDRYLELVDPMITWDEARAKVVRVQRRTTGSVTLTLRTTRQFKGFQAGQFVQLGVVIAGVRHVRCFSPANADSATDVIELTIARRAGGLVSNHLYKHAAVGDVYSLTPASGTFCLPQPHPIKTLLIAGGSGITPVLSMARSLLQNGYPGHLALLYYVPTASDNPYTPELEAMALLPSVSVHTVHTRAGGEHFGPEQLDALAPWHVEAQTYLCGPRSLHQSVEALYAERGLTDRLHTEEFAPAATTTPVDAGGTLRFSASKVAAKNNGQPILEQAEAAGLTPPFGCRMGICFSCTAIKKTGRTRNTRTGEDNDDPDQHIQLCITAPVGDVEIRL